MPEALLMESSTTGSQDERTMNMVRTVDHVNVGPDHSARVVTAIHPASFSRLGCSRELAASLACLAKSTTIA